MDALIYIASFVLALGILVTVHEFGHFWVARKLGVKVLRFSVGFGKVIWSRKSGPDQTEYVLSAIPLGGYVKMLDERESAVPEEEKHLAFNNKPVLSRIAIIVAGPGFNFLFAILALWVMYLNGIPGIRAVVGDVKPGSVVEQAGFKSGDHILSIDGKNANTWELVRLQIFNASLDRKTVQVRVRDKAGNEVVRSISLAMSVDPVDVKDIIGMVGFKRWSPPAILGKITPDGPADNAGLKEGDRIIAVSGNKMNYWIDWVKYVRKHPSERVKVQYERQGQQYVTDLVVGQKQSKNGVIGQVKVAMPKEVWQTLFLKQQYSVGSALVAGIVKTWDMSVLMLRVLARIVTGEASVRNISGPITIAQYAGDSASLGLVPFLSFLAIVSISLGVLNLLPIPVLDGGHLMYYIIELIKGSPVSEQVQIMGQQIGIFLLICLMALAFYNDLARLFG